jgi:Cd2+/Zn2+-exporting ATPase
MQPPQRDLLFKIEGMDCAEEVAVLKRAVGPLVGGEERLAFDILNGRMAVLPGPVEVSPQAVTQAVARTGMRADVWQGDEEVSDRSRFWQRHGRTVSTAASGLFTLAGFLAHVRLGDGFRAALGSEGMGLAHHVPLAAKALYTLGILAGAWYVLPKAWYAARRLRPEMNLLMTVAVIGAAAIGEWFEAAIVAFLFAVSLALESWSVGRARRAIAALMDLAPPTARLRHGDGREEQAPPEQLSVGAVFVVKPGEKLPLDGRVVRGASDVNQAPITGESVPVPKQPGNPVFAGTINGNGALEVECTKPAQDTTLAHIVRMVGEA